MKNHLLNHQAIPPDGTFTTSPQTESTTQAKRPKMTIVLVHSAWLGKWQWNAVVPYLEKEGHRVITPDLPGHGEDQTNPGSITMEDYIKQLIEIIDQENKPVLLVGHSFNGITISQTAELRPDKIHGLVYIAAFLLPKGGSFFKATQGVKDSEAVANFYLSEDQSAAFVKEAALHSAFAHDIPKEIFNEAKPLMVPEPAEPLTFALDTSKENFGRLPKYYIECTQDRAIPIAVQRAMYKDKVDKVYSLESSHTPNFSQPQALAEILIDIAQLW